MLNANLVKTILLGKGMKAGVSFLMITMIAALQVISGLTRNKFAASKRKGICIGVVKSMGYVVKNRELIIEPDEA